MSGSKKADQIYGVSSRFFFGKWEHRVYVFDDPKKALEWLHEEEYEFRERELMSKTDAVQLAGRTAVNEAINYEEVLAYRDRMNSKSEHTQETKPAKRQPPHRSAPER